MATSAILPAATSAVNQAVTRLFNIAALTAEIALPRHEARNLPSPTANR